MNNPLLKLVMFLGLLLSINNAFAICWSWTGQCGGGNMNIDIKNDTNYVLTVTNMLTNRASANLTEQTIVPGNEASINISYNGNGSHSITPSVKLDMLVAVSDDGTQQSKFDHIEQSIHGHFSCEETNPYGSGCVEGRIDRWENFKGSHTWYLDPVNKLSEGSFLGISLNTSKQGNNTYVYDYTMASNNPTDLPQGSNAWNPTDYAPSPYDGDVGK